MTDIQANLTFYRKKQGLTQAQLGELLHVSAQAISKWENGQAEPGIGMLMQLAEIYGVTTDELLKGDSSAATASMSELSGEAPLKEKKNLLRRYWYIPAAALALVIALVITLIALLVPTNYGKYIQNGDISLFATQTEIVSVLGKPTNSALTSELIWHSDDINYDNAEYYVYYDNEEAKTDEELWYGVKRPYLRLVFNTRNKLVEAFYCATPSTEVWSYSDAENLAVKSYTIFDGENNSDYGIVVFNDGSVYLGEVRESYFDSKTLKRYPLWTKIGGYDLPK